MTQLLLLGAVVALVVGTFWVSTRLALKPGSNVLVPYRPATDDLRAIRLVGLTIRTILRDRRLLWFGAAIALGGTVEFFVDPTGFNSWIERGHQTQPFWRDGGAFGQYIASKVLTDVLSSWVRVAVALAVTAILHGDSWNFPDILAKVRARWLPVTGFALLLMSSRLPGQLVTGLAPQHPMSWIMTLPLAVVLPFLLGLGAPALANENVGGAAAARRSVRLVASAFITRFCGQFLIELPLTFVAGAIVGFMTGTSNTPQFLFVAILPVITFALSVPLETASAVFDAALYLRLAPSESSEAPSAPASPPIPSPA